MPTNPKVAENTVVLHMLPRGTVRPSPSPFVMKLETFLRAANITYVADDKRPFSSDKSRTPWITFNGKNISDSQLCIEHLSAVLGENLNGKLSEEQRAEETAFRSLVEDHLYWCVLSLEIPFAKGKHFLPVMSRLLGPRFALPLAKKLMVRTASKYAYEQGMARNTKQEVEKLASDDLKALSTHLGQKAFFFGNEPTVLDCSVFGVLCMVLAGMPDDDIILRKLVEEELTNLKGHFERMKEKYWPDWDDLCVHQK